MKKKYDLRKVLVCEIRKQSPMKLDLGVIKTWADLNDCVDNAKIRFEEDFYYGLFLKTLTGYKHIMTDIKYSLASQNTAGEIVLVPDQIVELAKLEPALISHLIGKYGYNVDKEVICYLENRINTDFKSNENEEEFENEKM